MMDLADLAEVLLDDAGADCWEEVSRDGVVQPCDKPAVAIAYDESEGPDYYPVCAYHARVGRTVLLAAILATSARYGAKGATRALTEAPVTFRPETHDSGVDRG
jgi:hypothetical protein